MASEPQRDKVETWAPITTPSTGLVTLGTLLSLSFLICVMGTRKAPAPKGKLFRHRRLGTLSDLALNTPFKVLEPLCTREPAPWSRVPLPSSLLAPGWSGDTETCLLPFGDPQTW